MTDQSSLTEDDSMSSRRLVQDAAIIHPVLGRRASETDGRHSALQLAHHLVSVLQDASKLDVTFGIGLETRPIPI